MSDEQDATPTLAPDAGGPAPLAPPHASAAARTLPPSLTHLPAGAATPAPGVAPPGVSTWMTHQPTPRPAPGATPPTMSAPAPTSPMIGEFELLEPLGKGGMGVVYRARQWTLQRDVALKLLDPGFAADPEAAERFAREARAAAAVNHPNVITIIAAGRDPASGRLYMAMELVRGGDAEQLARSAGGKLPVRRALEVVRDAARGLGAIERAGLVHRDIKPANIFVTEDGVAKLADLGLARSRAGDDRVTQTGLVVGTPAYMPPEQARGAQDLDIRTDVYALGATLFRLLTGRPPYEAETMAGVLTALIRDPVPDPRARDPSIPPAVAALVVRAIAKDRASRFAGAAELVAALEAALRALDGAAPSSARAALADELLADDDDEEEDDDERGPPLAPLILAGVAMLVVVVGGVALLARPRRDDPAPVVASDRPPISATEPPTASEAPPPPAAVEAPPPPVSEAPPRPSTEPAPTVSPAPRPWLPVPLTIGGAARRCRALRENAVDLRPDGPSDLVTLTAAEGHAVPMRALWDVSRVSVGQPTPPPPGGGRHPPGRPRPKALAGLLWGDAPEGFVVMTGLSFAAGPVDEREDLGQGALAVVFLADADGRVRAGVLCVAPGATLADGDGDPLAVDAVVARSDLDLGPDDTARVLWDADADGWRVEVRVRDEVALAAERAWSGPAPATLWPWADASNSGREGGCAVSVQAQAID